MNQPVDYRIGTEKRIVCLNMFLAQNFTLFMIEMLSNLIDEI